MEQKVEAPYGIAARQKQLLESIVQEPYTRQTFYQDIIDATITSEEDYGFIEFFVRYRDNERTKVDFNRYSEIRLKKGSRWKDKEKITRFPHSFNMSKKSFGMI